MVVLQSNDRDYRTLFKMASRNEEVYKRYHTVFRRHSMGLLKGQKPSKKNCPPPPLPLYPLRSLGRMSDETVVDVLGLVVENKLELTAVEKTAKTAHHLQLIQAALIGVVDEADPPVLSWEDMERRFPQHTERDLLLNLFGKVSHSHYMQSNPIKRIPNISFQINN